MKEKFPNGPLGPRHSAIESHEDALAAVDEVNVYSILVRATEMIFDRSPEWKEKDPKTLIDEMVDRLPSKARIVSRTQAQRELAEPRSPLSDGFGEVTELEAYFLTKTLLQKSSSFYFSGAASVGDAPDSFAPAQSIRCMRDMVRTKKFMAAVRGAVEAASQRKEIVEVCDAGCGALPIMGIYAALSSPKARVTCLENNPHAVQLASAAIAAFGLSDRVTVERRDATKYVPRREIDVLVSETMDTGLIHEPMCAILNHLAPYKAERAAIIPSSVETFAAIVPERDLDEAGEFVQLAGKYIPRLDVDWIKTGLFIPGLDIRELGATLPMPAAREPLATLITSKVNFGSDSLAIYDSIISAPQSVQAKRRGGFERKTLIPRQGGSVRIAYAPGTNMEDIYLQAF